MNLLHHKLDTRYGCMYASLYAHLHDESLLEHIQDASGLRFAARIIERGFMLYPFYTHPDQPCGSEVWRDLWRHSEAMPKGGYIPLLITIASQRVVGARHMVAGIFQKGGHMYISDSSRDQLALYFGIEAFLLSPYTRAYEVNQLTSADVDAHPYVDAQEALGEAGGRLTA